MQAAPRRWKSLFSEIKNRLIATPFRQKHRRHERDFTRERVLTFPVVVLLLLQKTTRSIQRHAHSFLRQLLPDAVTPTVTGGAWTQARAKFRHTAFIELNQDILLPEVYGAEQAEHCQKWQGHRVLGIDGSTLRLPSREEIAQRFGIYNAGSPGADYIVARFSVVYDLLNDLGLDAQMAPQSTGEVDVAITQLKHVKKNDILIWDRGITGYLIMAEVLARGAHFVGRCSKSSFFAAQELFRLNRDGRSYTVKLRADRNHRSKLQGSNLPLEMVVRFISVRLPNGELEVLVTSLLDETIYPTREFLEVYHWRWGHETYHQMLKSRLDLENWSGQTLEAIRQDVYATVFLSNLESLLSQEVQEEMTQSDAQRKHPLQVNRAVSYHALKELLLELLFKEIPVDQAISQIQAYMRCNPVSVRKRKIPRPRPSLNRSYNYQRNFKKSVF